MEGVIIEHWYCAKGIRYVSNDHFVKFATAMSIIEATTKLVHSLESDKKDFFIHEIECLASVEEYETIEKIKKAFFNREEIRRPHGGTNRANAR